MGGIPKKKKKIGYRLELYILNLLSFCFAAINKHLKSDLRPIKLHVYNYNNSYEVLYIIVHVMSCRPGAWMEIM